VLVVYVHAHVCVNTDAFPHTQWGRRRRGYDSH